MGRGPGGETPLLSRVRMRIDANVKVFSPEFIASRERLVERDLTFKALYDNPQSRMATAKELIDAMDRAGIDVSVLASIGWSTSDLCRASNDYLLEASDRHPGRLIPFCSVNPVSGDEAVREIDRCVRLGARGVGELHPDWQGYDLGDRTVMAAVMEAAARRELPVLTHSSEPAGHVYPGKGLVTPAILYRFVANFPDARIIMAHWGGGLPFYALMPEVRNAMVNVWFDTAASPFLYEAGVFEAVASLVGADRILFATDYPLIEPDRLLRQIEQTGLSEEARDSILGGNAASLLGL